MRRRHFLASTGSALAVALAGCSRPPRVELQLTPLHESGLGERLVTPRRLLDPPQATAVRRAREDGSYVRTVSDESGPLLADGQFVSDDGAVFEIRTTRVDVEHRTVETFAVIYTGDGDGTTYELDEDARVVDYGDLPPADRAMFDALDPDSLLGAGDGTAVLHTHDYPDDHDSVLLPDPAYDAVDYEGETFAVEYEGRETVENGRFRYELDRLAPDTAAYVEQLAASVVFTLAASDLSEEQREMLDSAMEGGYDEERELSDAFSALLDRLRSHDSLDVGYADWVSVAEYERTEYLVEIDDNDFDDRTTDRPYRLPDEDDDGTTNGTTLNGTTRNATTTDTTGPPSD